MLYPLFFAVIMLMDLRLHLLTWNVVSRPPIEDLHAALNLEEPVDVSNLPDLYGLGLQEVSVKPQDLLSDLIIEDTWETAFRLVLRKWGYVKLKHIRLQGMVLYLYSKKEHVPHIRGLQTGYTRTGLKGMWGNKGGVAIRFSAYGCSICIVNSHLAAHDSEIKQRIEDYNTILDSQRFIDPQTENIITHDYSFWMGDLNFRLDDYTSEEILHLVETGSLAPLLSKDQLRRVMKLGQAFSEFSETSPVFPPTYKFHIDGEGYDTQKRRPAWTDRVLFRFTPNAYEDVTLALHPLTYTSLSAYNQSDHKPVTASFALKVFSEPKEKKVTFLPINDWKVNADSVAWYTFSEGVEPSTWDWIGLFKSEFTSTSEHESFVWAPVRPSSSTPDSLRPGPWYRVLFADQTLLVPGHYRLFYFSSEFEDILGISQPFQVLVTDSKAYGQHSF